MFVDYAKVSVQAGDGGKGCVSFRREKHVPRGGPDGGDGGDGGSVFFEANPSYVTLMDLRLRPLIRAKRGGHGRGKKCHGRNGEDAVIGVPLGTVIAEGDQVLGDLTRAGQRCLVAKGGKGGRGNARFATPTRRAPRIADTGMSGEEKQLVIELKQLAHIGLIGLPNAGKSTLLSKLTAANAQVGDYPFTTLHPNLGVIQDGWDEALVVADLPGLIEGASAGAGLGHRFLRHVERTRLLAHLVEVDPEDANLETLLARVQVVNDELEKYSQQLLEKPQILVFNKIDLLSEAARKDLETACKKQQMDVCWISAMKGEGIDAFRKQLIQHFAEVAKTETESSEDQES